MHIKNMIGDTLLLGDLADCYFFSALPNVDFTFKHSKSENWMKWIRGVRKLRIPILDFFFGDWYKDVDSLSKVILFDWGYQEGIENYILLKNPNCEVYYYNWNPIDNPIKLERVRNFARQNNVFSNDIEDCRRYGLRFAHSFYLKKWADKFSHDERDGRAVWLGVNKGREEILEIMARALRHFGVTPDIRIFGGCKDVEFSCERRMTYEDYCQWMSCASLLIDVNQKGQNATTLRVMESIFFEKKLLSTNKNLLNMDFYNENNICVVDEENIDIQKIADFIQKPFLPYSDDILKKYDYKGWIGNFR